MRSILTWSIATEPGHRKWRGDIAPHQKDTQCNVTTMVIRDRNGQNEPYEAYNQTTDYVKSPLLAAEVVRIVLIMSKKELTVGQSSK